MHLLKNWGSMLIYICLSYLSQDIRKGVFKCYAWKQSEWNEDYFLLSYRLGNALLYQLQENSSSVRIFMLFFTHIYLKHKTYNDNDNIHFYLCFGFDNNPNMTEDYTGLSFD